MDQAALGLVVEGGCRCAEADPLQRVFLEAREPVLEVDGKARERGNCPGFQVTRRGRRPRSMAKIA